VCVLRMIKVNANGILLEKGAEPLSMALPYQDSGVMAKKEWDLHQPS